MKKTVLVTGGASGLGKSLSECFAKEGYDIALTYNNSKKQAEFLKSKLEDKYQVKVLILKCDLSKEEEIKTSIQKVIEVYGKIDVLINNAAVEIDKEFNLKTKDDFMYTLEVNLVGTFLISRCVADIMYQNKYGKIVNISSNNAFDKNDPITLEYDASKLGIISLTHNFAKQYAPYVNVNAIAPGWIKTEKIMIENISLDGKLNEEESKKILLNRFAEEEDICNLILFLSSDKAAYINDEIIKIDGGSR